MSINDIYIYLLYINKNKNIKYIYFFQYLKKEKFKKKYLLSRVVFFINTFFF